MEVFVATIQWKVVQLSQTRCLGRVDPKFPVYRALDDPSDNDVEGDYIYRSPGSSGSWRIRSVWWSSGAWCDEFPGTSGQRSSFDALEEPFLGLDGSISCLNGFYSRSYQYRSRDDLVIRCNRKRNASGGSNNNGSGSGTDNNNNNNNSGGGVIFVSPAPTRELSSASLFMSTMMLGLTTWFTLWFCQRVVMDESQTTITTKEQGKKNKTIERLNCNQWKLVTCY